MNPTVYRLILKYRTEQNVFMDSRACTARRGLQISDSTGDHDSHSPGWERRIRRHNVVRNVLFAFDANMGPSIEVAGLLDSGEKFADILVPVWDNGRDLCVDVSIVSHFGRGETMLESGEAARRVEDMKIAKYEANCSAKELIFESLGGFRERADQLMRTITSRWTEAMGTEPPTALSTTEIIICLAEGFDK